jgi:hypothetical protein
MRILVRRGRFRPRRWIADSLPRNSGELNGLPIASVMSALFRPITVER